MVQQFAKQLEKTLLSNFFSKKVAKYYKKNLKITEFKSYNKILLA